MHEMVTFGLIRLSVSPYSFLIVMVKKKYESWRKCIEYKELNKYTVRDKFPITVIEELLDELGCAQLFIKLDLRTGYHQIRMMDKYKHKTTFRSQHGHYEFVMIPFGLKNSPSTYKSLMNHIFQPYL